jgi:hypothetical protein
MARHAAPRALPPLAMRHHQLPHPYWDRFQSAIHARDGFLAFIPSKLQTVAIYGWLEARIDKMCVEVSIQIGSSTVHGLEYRIVYFSTEN